MPQPFEFIEIIADMLYTKTAFMNIKNANYIKLFDKFTLRRIIKEILKVFLFVNSENASESLSYILWEVNDESEEFTRYINEIIYRGHLL